MDDMISNANRALILILYLLPWTDYCDDESVSRQYVFDCIRRRASAAKCGSISSASAQPAAPEAPLRRRRRQTARYGAS